MAQRPDLGKERRWLDLVRQWQESRLSIRQFCGRRRLSEPTFYAWRRVLRQRGLIDKHPSAAASAATTPTFLQVAVDSDALTAPAIDLVLPQGRLLRVRAGFDPALLRQLLRLLEEPSC